MYARDRTRLGVGNRLGGVSRPPNSGTSCGLPPSVSQGALKWTAENYAPHPRRACACSPRLTSLTTVLFVSFRALGEDLVLDSRLLKKPETVNSDATTMVREYDSVQQVC